LAVPCPRLRWFGRNRFPVPCPPPMWSTSKCGLRNTSKKGIFENPQSEVYFTTIRGLIVVNQRCTLITIYFLSYWHPTHFFDKFSSFERRYDLNYMTLEVYSLCEIANSSGDSSTSRTTTGTRGRTFTLAEIREMSPVHPKDGRCANFGQPVPLSPPWPN